jgi:hypothetical protein
MQSMISHSRSKFCATAVLVSALSQIVACSLPGPLPDHDERVKRAYIYYLDGAGGGSPARNWALGLRQGLLDAGYRGSGEMFPWETGAGITADQVSSSDYKRGKARELAAKIVEFKRLHPNVPVDIVALSAGTAVAAFTLEALPPDVMVDTVIFFGASISADYNMSSALRHVSNKLYLFTSDRDAVLNVAVKSVGTADREAGGKISAGLAGFALPPGASSATRSLYSQKIKNIPWRRDFERTGNFGGHTDGVKAAFVKEFVAPLITARGYADSAPGQTGR